MLCGRLGRPDARGCPCNLDCRNGGFAEGDDIVWPSCLEVRPPLGRLHSPCLQSSVSRHRTLSTCFGLGMNLLLVSMILAILGPYHFIVFLLFFPLESWCRCFAGESCARGHISSSCCIACQKQFLICHVLLVTSHGTTRKASLNKRLPMSTKDDQLTRLDASSVMQNESCVLRCRNKIHPPCTSSDLHRSSEPGKVAMMAVETRPP